MLPYFSLTLALIICAVDGCICYGANILYVLCEVKWGKRYILTMIENSKPRTANKDAEACATIGDDYDETDVSMKDPSIQHADVSIGGDYTLDEIAAKHMIMSLSIQETRHSIGWWLCYDLKQVAIKFAKLLIDIWHDCKELPLTYWCVVGMIFCLSPILYTFTAFGPLYFQDKWNLSETEAGTLSPLLLLGQDDNVWSATLLHASLNTDTQAI